MPRGGAHFSSEEASSVLSHYDIGVIHQLKPLSAGNRRAPKMVVSSDRGKFLLKRRPRGKDDFYRVAFAHAVQTHLAKRNFPVTDLIATRDEGSTIVQMNNHIYELFRFVPGSRYDGSAQATVDAGRQLANLHLYLADFTSQSTLLGQLRASYHDCASVRRQLRVIGTNKMRGSDFYAPSQDKKLQKIAEILMQIYNDCSVRVNTLGYDNWGQQVIHGDWHPGNMLFSKGRLIAVLDFDSIKVAPPITDLANGMLQFSIVGGRPNPADWPDYFDQAKMTQFLEGYLEVIKLDKDKRASLIDLMVEAMIAEAVLPVAATGSFGGVFGLDFLKMIHRKADWLIKNSASLMRVLSV